MSERTVLTTVIAAERDVFAVRALGREVAALLGLEPQDQVRVATALSEVGRHLLARLGPVEVVFTVPDGPPMLLIRASAATGGAGVDGLTTAIQLASRLMEHWETEATAGRLVVTMGRRLPAAGAPLTTADVERLRAAVARMAPPTPLGELAEQNRALMGSLIQIQGQRDELLALNAELEETNKGVLALYRELSDELDETNRGVVALYAELDQKSEQLRAASESKTRFLANVSHELRAPATAIIGLLRLLLDRRSDPISDEQRHQLELVQRSARELLGLVNDLLDLAKAESGRLEPRWSQVDLGSLLTVLRDTHRSLIASSDVDLDVRPPEPDQPFITDETLLTHVLRNLVTNAIKFTPHGHVRVSASYADDPDTVAIVVADTGAGIAPADLERVFEEFYQAGVPVATTGAKGTGLGLPYARRLVSLLGGTLQLTSTVGEGTTATVTLPRRPSVADAAGPALTVVIIDDDDSFREGVGGLLRGVGARVVQATEATAALAAISHERPDVILLDLRLPGADGTFLLERLATSESAHDIPVVVLTAYAEEFADQGALGHASLVLRKAETPIDELPGLLRSVVERHPPAEGGPR
jgi:signal transduction histidine kinase